MQLHTVGIVGYGAFGVLIHTLITKYAPSIDVRIYSSRKEPDSTFYTFEDTAQCDALILTVPIHAFEETVQKALLHMRTDTILVDVATVKSHTVDVLKRLAPSHPYIATHPMFGPESYEKKEGNISGFRIVVCDSTLETTDTKFFIAALRGVGFDVVEMSAADHDKHLAETLFLTHFIGQAVHRAGFDRTAIDTVSFGHLMDAVESVKNDTQLFQDVFRFNPYCKGVLDRFENGEEIVRSILERG